MGKRELVTFGSLSKQARTIASRYLFACISLGRLDSNKMQTCFEAFDQGQLACIRRFNVTLRLPLLPADRAEERTRTKGLGVLLGREPQLRNLELHIFFEAASLGFESLVQPPLDSLSMLAEAAQSHRLVLDFTRWKDAGRSSTRFWPVFTYPVLGPVSSQKIRHLKIIQFDSHFGKRAADGINDADRLLDFTNPSIIEQSMIKQMAEMEHLTSLHLQACNLSTHFDVPYAFKLLSLVLDFEGVKVCQHNANYRVALALIRANHKTLRELQMKGWYFSNGEDLQDSLGMSSLISLTIDNPPLSVTQAAVMLASLPRLTSLFLRRTSLEDPAYTRLAESIASLPSVMNITLEACDLHRDDPNWIREFISMCKIHDVALRIVWPGYDTTGTYAYEIWDYDSSLVALQSCVQKMSIDRHLPETRMENIMSLEMRILQHLRLSFAPFDSPHKPSYEHGLPSDHLLVFLDRLTAPCLEVLEINFCSPFIDYLRSFASYIASGNFASRFPLCREINGSITADDQSVWEASNPYQHPKILAVWLKELFIKACTEHKIAVTGLLWKNAALVL